MLLTSSISRFLQRTETSKLPPPKSRMFCSAFSFLSSPYAMAAAVGSLMIRNTFSPAITPFAEDSIEGLHGLRHVAMSCDNLYCNFLYCGQASMARQWNGAYCQSLSAVARAKYESKVLQAGLGIVSYSIDYLTPAVLYFARNRQMDLGGW